MVDGSGLQPTRIDGRSTGAAQARGALSLALLLVALPTLAVVDRLWQVWGAPAAASWTAVARGCVMLGWLVAAGLLAPTAVARLSLWLRPRRRARAWLAALAVGGAVLATTVVYPVVDSGQLGFHSDRDEALDVGARELLSGHNPYRCRVLSGEHAECLDQGNPIGPLPGGLLLSAPFVWAGGASALQNIAWFALAWLIALRRRVAPEAAVATLAVACACAPIAWAELVTGGDLLANTLAVTLPAASWATRARADRTSLALVLLLGVALAWRSHFLLALPVLAAWQARRWGWRATLLQLGACGALFAALVLPFLLHDPAGFGPLQVQQKLRVVGGDVGQAIALAASAAAAVLAAVLARTRLATWLGCAVVLMLPGAFAVLFESWAQGRFAPAFYGWYLLGGLGFATLAACEAMVRITTPGSSGAEPDSRSR